MRGWVLVAAVVAGALGCGGRIEGHGSDAAAVDGPAADATGAPDGPAAVDATVAADAAGADAAPGGASFRGTVHFVESFEDGSFAARGWYDSPSATLSTAEHKVGSRSFECRFAGGATHCSGGTPGRHAIPESGSVYLSFWVKHTANWVGSGRAYHPHLFHFTTNADGIWVGPSATHLTTYIEHVNGKPLLALQDSLNVNTACVLLNNDSFVGCGGDFSTYEFTEARSACACNGLLGDLPGRDCFSTGGGYYSVRSQSATKVAFGDTAGPYYKGDWHFVATYFRLSSIQSGKGVADGAIRYFFDGELLISSDRVLLRTGQHPSMAFNQFIVAPYIGDGSPVDQTIWIDELTVAAGVP